MANSPLPGWDGILEEGAEILWQGAPEAGLDFSGFWLVQTAFDLFFTGFLRFWITMANMMTGQLNNPLGRVINAVFPLFGGPFLLVGLHMLLGRFWTEAQQRCNSDDRLINRVTCSGGATQVLQSIGFERPPNARELYTMMRKVQIDRANTKGSKDA